MHLTAQRETAERARRLELGSRAGNTNVNRQQTPKTGRKPPLAFKKPTNLRKKTNHPPIKTVPTTSVFAGIDQLSLSSFYLNKIKQKLQRLLSYKNKWCVCVEFGSLSHKIRFLIFHFLISWGLHSKQKENLRVLSQKMNRQSNSKVCSFIKSGKMGKSQGHPK